MTRRLLSLAAVAALAGCTPFGPPRPETLAALQPMPLGAQLAADLRDERSITCTLELETPVMTGVFDVVGGVPAAGPLQLQLFPDVGGKLLDMTVGPGWSSLSATAAGASYVASDPLDDAEPHVALLLAALFGELLSAPGPARVLGERASAAGPVLRLVPAVGSGGCEATLGADGAISAYRIRLGVFRIELLADGSFSGPRVRGRICR